MKIILQFVYQIFISMKVYLSTEKTDGKHPHNTRLNKHRVKSNMKTVLQHLIKRKDF